MIAAEGGERQDRHVDGGERPGDARHEAGQRRLKLDVEGDQAVGSVADPMIAQAAGEIRHRVCGDDQRHLVLVGEQRGERLTDFGEHARRRHDAVGRQRNQTVEDFVAEKRRGLKRLLNRLRHIRHSSN
ncbi:MAG: hypothetical protein U0703_03320 [Anaerolineae bacterium]